MAKSKKNRFNSRAKNLWLLLILVIVLLLMVFYKPKQHDNGERNGFNELSSELKVVQSKLNAVNAGWKYKESCVGKGGVYEQDEASYCSLSIFNESVSGDDIKIDYSEYSNIIDDSFLLQQPVTESRWLISDRYDVRKYKTSGYSFERFPDTNCSLNEFFTESVVDSRKGGVSFTCTHNASQFYYRRADL